jgi:hypothetical protein
VFVSYHRFSMGYGRFGDCRNMRGGSLRTPRGRTVDWRCWKA